MKMQRQQLDGVDGGGGTQVGGADSELVLGGVKKKHFSGKFKYHKLISEGCAAITNPNPGPSFTIYWLE